MIKILRISFCLNLILSLNSYGIEGAEFAKLMTEHKARISKNAKIVYQGFPRIFGDFDTSLMSEYLNLHDLPKLFTLSELNRYGYIHQETIYQRLAKYYGKNKSDLSPAQTVDLTDTIDWLNKIENILKEEFFTLHDINFRTRESLAKLEHILDVTDTGVMRKKELGLADTRYDGGKFLDSEQQYSSGYISKWLEDKAYLDQNKCKDILEK